MADIEQQRRDAIQGLTDGIKRIQVDRDSRIAEIRKHADDAIKEHRDIIASHRKELAKSKRSKAKK